MDNNSDKHCLPSHNQLGPMQENISSSNLEDVESFKLNVATFFFQHVHHQLEVVGVGDIPGHDGEVVAVQQQFTQQLQKNQSAKAPVQNVMTAG